MRSGLPLALLGALGCACTTDAPSGPYQCIAAGGEGCFELPTDPIAAADESGQSVLPVLDCGPFEVTTAAAPVTLSGEVQELGSLLAAVDGVRLEAFSDLELSMRLFDVTTDASGTWSAIVGALPSLVFTRATRDDRLPVYTLYARTDTSQAVLDMQRFSSASQDAVEAVLESVGDRFWPGTSHLFLDLRDCAGNRLMNVIANVAPASGKNGSKLFTPGVRVYYTNEADPPVFARRTEVSQSMASGRALLSRLPAGKHHVQLWGFPSEPDVVRGAIALKLLAEHEIYVYSEESAFEMTLHGRL